MDSISASKFARLSRAENNESWTETALISWHVACSARLSFMLMIQPNWHWAAVETRRFTDGYRKSLVIGSGWARLNPDVLKPSDQ